jgi:anti-sigma-K factor RskA
MERHGIHELSAAYALDALDDEERDAYEDHLATCADCRRDVAAFQETAAAMAYEVESPEPSPALRERVLEGARSERPNVVPLRERRRWAFPAAVGIAAAAACAALALGLWGASLASDLSNERAALDESRQVVSVLQEPDATRVPLSGADGLLVVDPSGEGWLVVSGLEPAPADRTYEAWVIDDDDPVPAGLFEGGGRNTVVKLSEDVPEGAVVAVTVERAGGVEQPTSEPIITASPDA